MPEMLLEEVADKAEMIISGYAFTSTEEGVIRVLNLENPEEACVLQKDGTMIETTMNDVAVLKVQAYYLKNKEFMEESNA